MHANTHSHQRDLMGGLLIIALGLGTLVVGAGYHVGEMRRMGPGFFPVAIGALLALTGLIIAFNGWRGMRNERAAPHAHARKDEPVDWRGTVRAWVAILASLIVFVLLGHSAGLLPASFAIVFISALGDRQNTWKNALVFAAALTVVSWLLFGVGLRISLPLVNLSWLGL